MFKAIEFTETDYQKGYCYPNKPSTSSRQCKYCQELIRVVYDMPWTSKCPQCHKMPFTSRIKQFICSI